MRFETFGVVGHGHFGQFLAASLARLGKVLAYDVDDAKLDNAPDGVRSAPLVDVAAADVLILAVPLSAPHSLLHQVRDLPGRDPPVMHLVSTNEPARKPPAPP